MKELTVDPAYEELQNIPRGNVFPVVSRKLPEVKNADF
jgi:hypothetical protein